jgi:hypothetical protein
MDLYDIEIKPRAGLSASTDKSIPGGSYIALRDFILTLPSSPASHLCLISRILETAPAAIKDPVTDIVKKLVSELPLLCEEDEFHELMEGQGCESRVPFNLSDEREVGIWEVYREMVAFGPARYRVRA